MSELVNAARKERNFRWRLLTTVSSLALIVAICGATELEAAESDADRPTVWIEFGGQLEQLKEAPERFSPPFVANLPGTFFSPLGVQKPASFTYGGEGAISFEPQGSDWVFSGSVRYGRSNGAKSQHQQTPNEKVPVNVTYSGLPIIGGSYYPNLRVKFEDATAKQSQSHAVLDFKAGKDLGLGLFGDHASSVVSAGVRIAQFTSKESVNLRAEPDIHYPTAPIVGTLFAELPALHAFKYAPIHFHDYAASLTSQRSFQGLGPSLAWNGSIPIAGNAGEGDISVDWGANAAVLFGRQKAKVHHQTTVRSYTPQEWRRRGSNGCGQADPCLKSGAFSNNGTSYYTAHATAHNTGVANNNRSRIAVVPNFGAFAGLSFLYSDAKVSFGYRADFFLGAMDQGIDVRRAETLGFFGPFATISAGFP